MAIKKGNVNDRINANRNQGKKVSIQLSKEKTSFTDNMSSDDTNVIDDIHTLEKDDITTTSSDLESISFKSYINNAYKLNSDEIKYEIDIEVLNAVNSVQVRYDRDEDGKTIRVNYFDDKINNKLLIDVVEKIRDLVQSIKMSADEKNDYFSRIIDDFLRQRLKYIIKIGLEEMFTPEEFEHSMTVFMSSGKDFFENYDELLNEYLGYYLELAFYLVESRVDRCTFYINELNLEAIKLIKKDKTLDVSAYINELISNNIDSKYITQARKNMYDRKPFNNMITKTHKKVMKQHDLI
jgi:hypothetical protein